MIRMSIAVQSVPARAAYAAQYCQTLALAAEDARRNGYEVAEPRVVEDTNYEGPWACWQKAWWVRDPKSTHHCVLQDDTRGCLDLPATLVAVARARPETLILGFNFPSLGLAAAVANGVWWRRHPVSSGLTGQCLLWPAALGDACVSWLVEHEAELPARALARKRPAGWFGPHDDRRLTEALKVLRPGSHYFATVPTLVDHIADELGGSVMKHGSAPQRKRSCAFIGATSLGATLP